jgi:cholesterol transport system auxiliary component
MRCRYLLVALSALLGLSACSLPGARTQAIQYFVLEAPALVPASVPPAAVAKANRPLPVLLLRDAEASVFTQNPRLIYSRSPGTRGYYLYALWTESPPKRLHTLLRQRLLASGLYAGVVPLGAGVQGDYQLNFRLLEFFHDAAQTPGRAQVRLDAELVERGSARLIAQQDFAAEVPLTSQDAAAAAAGLGQASSQTLDAMLAWLARVQPNSVVTPQAR